MIKVFNGIIHIPSHKNCNIGYNVTNGKVLGSTSDKVDSPGKGNVVPR